MFKDEIESGKARVRRVLPCAIEMGVEQHPDAVVKYALRLMLNGGADQFLDDAGPLPVKLMVRFETAEGVALARALQAYAFNRFAAPTDAINLAGAVARVGALYETRLDAALAAVQKCGGNVEAVRKEIAAIKYPSEGSKRRCWK